ncbi:hypothetical protein PVK06_020297 [Gossypium arboreum]|uniref:Uncharacterized protein n=1 Tax=Gossypium arboreum TaxID=29729 RepID=A0ABR0PME7_GOSAR|nr:hypothetical protein PVK06_020297 [Gossypium arboreum]
MEFDRPNQAFQNLRLDPMSYVDEVYKIEYMYNVWRHVLPPVSDERIVVPPTEDLVVSVGRMTHLDRIMTAEVFESHKVIGIGKKKSFSTTPHAIPHATVAYRSAVDSE